MMRQRLAHLCLLARQRSHECGMLGEEVYAPGHGLLIDRGADDFCEARRLFQRVAGLNLMAADDDRAFGL